MGATDLPVVEGADMTISCEWEFHVLGPDSDGRLQVRGDRVMSALLDLESADPRITDSAVSLDLGSKVMTVGLVVAGVDYEETVAHALTSIRAAIHAAGGSTRDWEASAGTLEPQGFRAAAV